MDDLDRLYRRLVHNVRATRPEYFQLPFTVRELYEVIVPYRHNRRELAIETNDDYETAVARLLSGERGYVQTDPAMQEALRRELASPTGDPGIFKDHGDDAIRLGPNAESARTPLPAGGVPSATIDTPVITPNTAAVGTSFDTISLGAASASVNAAFDAMSPGTVLPSTTPIPVNLGAHDHPDAAPTCRFCNGALPEGREVNYCPHCGENLLTKRCPSCGTEMDAAWQFCVSCGRKA